MSIYDACDWPESDPFKYHDDPDPHAPAYVVMPGGAMLAFNHHDRAGVDQDRARFVTRACNQYLQVQDAAALMPQVLAEGPVDLDALRRAVNALRQGDAWLTTNSGLYINFFAFKRALIAMHGMQQQP